MAGRPLKKRTVRAERPAVPAVQKPKCSRHRAEMMFNTDRMVWECPEPGCKMVAHPQNDVGGSRPVSFKPPFELMQIIHSETKEEKYLLRKDKVFFDITEMVGTYTANTGVLILKPNTFVRIDENGRPLS